MRTHALGKLGWEVEVDLAMVVLRSLLLERELNIITWLLVIESPCRHITNDKAACVFLLHICPLKHAYMRRFGRSGADARYRVINNSDLGLKSFTNRRLMARC